MRASWSRGVWQPGYVSVEPPHRRRGLHSSFYSRQLSHSDNFSHPILCKMSLSSCISANLTKPWNLYYLSFNPFLTIGDIQAFGTTNPGWDWDKLSEHIDFSQVVADDSLPWNFEVLSQRYGVDFNFVRSHLAENWNWMYLSNYASISDVLSDPTLPWDWDILTCNFLISLLDIFDNATLPWNWEYASYNPTLSYAYVLQHPDFDWDFERVSLIIDTDSASNRLSTQPVQTEGDDRLSFALKKKLKG